MTLHTTDYIAYSEADEQQVIGAMISHSHTIEDMISKIKPTDFYTQSNQAICQAIFDVYEEYGTDKVNIIVEVTQVLVDKGYEDGLFSKINDACNQIVSDAYIDHYSDKVVTHSLARKFEATTAQLAALRPKGRDELEAVLSQAETAIANLSDESVLEDNLTDTPDMFDRYFDRLESIRKNGNAITGLATGIPDLDKLTAGFQKSDLIILAGRPSMGKTAFALELAMGMREHKANGIFFEIEMNEDSVANRMVARHARINSRALQTGVLTASEVQTLAETRIVLRTKYQGLRIDTTPSITISQMKAQARKLKRMGELDFIVVDYLQLIFGVEGRNRTEEIGKIARHLKLMARELEVPVIALSQLSRGVEQRQDKRPMMSDLRDSGEIEQHADIVIFMYRDDYYNENSTEPGIAEAIISKQRNGALGKVKLLYKKEINSFKSLDFENVPDIYQDSNKELTASNEALAWKKNESEVAAVEESDEIGEPLGWDGVEF